jgi:hypothetical protein
VARVDTLALWLTCSASAVEHTSGNDAGVELNLKFAVAHVYGLAVLSSN